MQYAVVRNDEPWEAMLDWIERRWLSSREITVQKGIASDSDEKNRVRTEKIQEVGHQCLYSYFRHKWESAAQL